MKTYSRPHYRQSHVWKRFASILSSTRAYAYERKEEALKWSIERGASGFAIPTELELRPTDSRGLKALKKRVEVGDRFPELSLRQRYNEERDVVEIEVALHRCTQRQGTQHLSIGLLPERDARWARPLLKNHLELTTFVADIKETGGAGFHTGLSVTVAISRPDRAAREWIDIYDARKQAARHGKGFGGGGVPAYIPAPSESAYPGTDWGRKIQKVEREIGRLQIKANELERRRLSCAGINRKIAAAKAKLQRLRARQAKSRSRRADGITAEDWLRENVATRETCMTDLGNEDYWSAQHRVA